MPIIGTFALILYDFHIIAWIPLIIETILYEYKNMWLKDTIPIIGSHLRTQNTLQLVCRDWRDAIFESNKAIIETISMKYPSRYMHECAKMIILANDISTLNMLLHTYKGFLPIDWPILISYIKDRKMFDMVCRRMMKPSGRNILQLAKYGMINDVCSWLGSIGMGKMEDVTFSNMFMTYAIEHERIDILEYLHSVKKCPMNPLMGLIKGIRRNSIIDDFEHIVLNKQHIHLILKHDSYGIYMRNRDMIIEYLLNDSLNEHTPAIRLLVNTGVRILSDLLTDIDVVDTYVAYLLDNKLSMIMCVRTVTALKSALAIAQGNDVLFDRLMIVVCIMGSYYLLDMFLTKDILERIGKYMSGFSRKTGRYIRAQGWQ